MSASLLEIDWPVITTIDYMLFGALLPLLGAMAFFSFVEATFFALVRIGQSREQRIARAKPAIHPVIAHARATIRTGLFSGYVTSSIS
jgi:hypothetical protein